MQVFSTLAAHRVYLKFSQTPRLMIRAGRAKAEEFAGSL